MNTYYEILGLLPGASQMEIKKAYFKQVRQHSPESDPEQFQKIREAYERLSKGGGEENGPVFPAPDDYWEKKMLEQIEQYQKSGMRELFRDACEEAWRLFPNNIQFLYLLAIAQRKCGNTGKAVKNAELLAKKEPGNKWFCRELALSYLDRGYAHKAYAALGKAYELGCRDHEFLLTYAMECNENGDNDRGVKILLEITEAERKWARDDIPELAEAYMGLLHMGRHREESLFTEILQSLCNALEQYRIFLAEYMPEMAFMIFESCGCRRADKQRNKIIERIFDVMDKSVSEEGKDALIAARLEYDHQRILQDERIGSTLECAYEIFYTMEELSERTMKFALTDVQLCMLEEREAILEQAEILKTDYPDFYEKVEDFIERLRKGTNLSYLKESLLKTYRRLSLDFSEGLFYEKYPQEKEYAQEKTICDGTSEDPYVRSGKKIGRNDPCPCGSGKKYKHCCMKTGKYS